MSIADYLAIDILQVWWIEHLVFFLPWWEETRQVTKDIGKGDNLKNQYYTFRETSRPRINLSRRRCKVCWKMIQIFIVDNIIDFRIWLIHITKNIIWILTLNIKPLVNLIRQGCTISRTPSQCSWQGVPVSLPRRLNSRPKIGNWKACFFLLVSNIS